MIDKEIVTTHRRVREGIKERFMEWAARVRPEVFYGDISEWEDGRIRREYGRVIDRFMEETGLTKEEVLR